MRKPDIFDEVILCLNEAARDRADFSVAPELLNELFSPLPPRETTEVLPQIEVAPPKQPRGKAGESPVRTEGVRTLPDLSGYGWDQLEQTAAVCQACPLHTGRTNPVFGSGNRNAELMFIGEGPGADEDAQGLPFVGRAGELLTRMITAMRFDREKEVYIANIVKCRPPGNRTPVDEEANICRNYVLRQIELVGPKVIVLLGATPLKYLFGIQGIMRMRGKWLDFRGIRVMPTYHPAFLLRDANRKVDVWRDLQLVMRELGRFPQK